MIAWTIYLTFLGAFLLLFLPHVFARWMALITAVAGFAHQSRPRSLTRPTAPR